MSSKVKSLQEVGKQSPTLQVVSYDTADSFGPRYNPDTLIGRKGYAIYSQMLQDEQVKAVVQFRRDAILSPGWELQFTVGSSLSADEQARRIQIITAIFARMRGALSDALAAICLGHIYGFSMTEKVYDQFELPDGTPVAGLNCLLPRPVDTFYFTVDAWGVLQKVEQRINGRALDVDVTKFIHYVHNPQEDRFYGESDLRAAHRAWYAKGETLKLYLQYLARFAGGFAALTQDGDSALTPSSPDYQKLQSMLSNFRSTMGVILPRGVSLEIHSPAATSEYRDAMVMFDMQVAKALLVPNLLGVSHTGETGSFAQSQTQLEAFFWTLQADTKRLEDCITEQLIADLCARNWDDGEVPQFKFKPLSQEETKWIIDKWVSLLGVGAVKPSSNDEGKLRDLLDFPAREEEAEQPGRLTSDEAVMVADVCGLVRSGALPVDSAKAILLASTSLPEDTVAAILDPIEVLPASSASSDPLNPDVDKTGDDEQEDGAGTTEDEMTDDEPGDKKAAFSRAVSRVDFAVLAQRAAVVSESTVPMIARGMARAVRRLLSDDRMGELLDQDVQDIGELRIDGGDIGKIKATIKDTLARAWRVGQDAARREMVKATEDKADLFASFAALKDNVRDVAASYFEANGFRMAANLTDGMRSIIQQELLQGVKSGARPPEVVAGIYDRLVRKGFTTLEALQLEEPRETVLQMAADLLADALDVANVPAYINTLVRTNTFEALNEARFAEFTDPALEGFVTGLEYSAIMDDRVTDICAHMDGRMYLSTSPVWDQYRPPNHYNCRSILIPITTADGWSGGESAAPVLEPQEGFGRG
jgi:SPP1 gp7 family putative phage head morphogenesis protein